MNPYAFDQLEFFKSLLTIFLSLWQVWVVLIILAIIKARLPYLKGAIGEKFVSRKLFKLDPDHYKVLDDLLLPSNGSLSTTQIDHVVVSNYGIFCIETKSYKEWIIGNTEEKYWIQKIYGQQKFYNPLWQNLAHTKAIEELVKSKCSEDQIRSLVAFPYAKLKISGSKSYKVGNASDVIRKIESYKIQEFTDAKRDEIYNILANANIRDKKLRKLHDKSVRDLKYAKTANSFSRR